MLPAPCLPAAALCITASPTTLYRFFCQVITTSLWLCLQPAVQQDGLPFDFCNEEMISFVELDALQHAKSNDFSFSKELVRFVPDVLYCGARFIMGGKQTGEHTHALVSRRFCSAYCMPLMLLQAGVQGCMQVFKNSYTFTCLTQMVQSESIIVFTFSTYRHSLLL